jgi:hypothetical protein
MELSERDGYGHLLAQIRDTFLRGRVRALRATNQELPATYWQVGRYVVEFEQARQRVRFTERR